MKHIPAIGFVIALAGAANAQFSQPDPGFVRSVSDQFIVHGATQTSPSALEQVLAERTGLPPSRMWLLSQALTWSPSATSTLAVVIWTPMRSIARMVVTVAKLGSSSVSASQRFLGGMMLRLSSVMCRAPRSAR